MPTHPVRTNVVIGAVALIVGIFVGREFPADARAPEAPSPLTVGARPTPGTPPGVEHLPETISAEDRARGLQEPRAEEGVNGILPEEDFSQTAKMIQNLPEGQSKDQAIRELTHRWVRVDASAAVSWIRQLIAGPVRNEALTMALSEMSRTAPRVALALSRQESDVSLQRQLDEAIFRSWVEVDPKSAAVAVMELQAPDQRRAVLNQIVEKWASRDFISARAWVLGLPEGLAREEATKSLLPKFASLDAPGAAALVASWPSAKFKNESLGTIASIWGAKDINGAVAWARNLPEGAGKQNAFAALGPMWAEVAPQAVAEYARSLPVSNGRAQLLESTASQWARNNPSGAVAWAKQMPEGEDRDRFVGGVAATLAQTSPAQAADLVTTMIGEGYFQGEAIANVTGQWAQSSPAEVAEWAKNFPDGPLRERAMDQVMTQWAKQNAPAAEAWLKGLPPGPAADSATRAYIGTLLQSDPASAARWAESITSTDGYFRQGMMENAGRAWLQTGDPAAKAWVENAQIPVSIKTALLKLVSNP